MTSKDSLKDWIMDQARDIGFDHVGIAATDISHHIEHFKKWLEQDFHGDMGYMKNRQSLRENIDDLVPGTLSIISVRLNYVSTPAKFTDTLSDANKANISRYALGRDYHKLMRKRLAKLADRIKQRANELSFRAFVDSAPVLERAYAESAGLGWIGKNTMLINQQAGSFFFLGELLTNLPLEPDTVQENQCGACQSCLQICPTEAIVAPYSLDARRCISYLTIEHGGSIDKELRPLMGNRIYGCDDCQLVCPWNRYAQSSQLDDFKPRNNFNDVELLTLFAWNESDFLKLTEGSPIRRIGFERWQRNIAIALGNADGSTSIIAALEKQLADSPSALVREHIEWALEQQRKKLVNDIPIFVQTKAHKKLIRTTQKITGHLEENK